MVNGSLLMLHFKLPEKVVSVLREGTLKNRSLLLHPSDPLAFPHRLMPGAARPNSRRLLVCFNFVSSEIESGMQTFLSDCTPNTLFSSTTHCQLLCTIIGNFLKKIFLDGFI